MSAAKAVVILLIVAYIAYQARSGPSLAACISAGICCGPPGSSVCAKQCGTVGTPCYTSTGTPWPLSGCTANAGLCCNGVCSTGLTC